VALVDTTPFGPVHVLVILAAVMANGAVNIALFVGIAARVSGAPGRVLLREEVGATLLTTAIGGGVGVLAAYFYVHDPILLPLVAGPALLARTHTAARRREADAMAAERDRLSRAIEGVTDGIALVDADRHLVLANESFLRLVGPVPVGQEVCPWLRLTTPDGQALPAPDVDASDGVSVYEGRLRGRTVRVVRQAMRDGSHRTGEVIQVRDVTREREVSQLREDFVSRVSHELRTPLTSITGAIDTLVARADVLQPSQTAELLDAAQRNGARLERLVSSLLVRARIERRGMASTRTDVELRPLVASVLGEVLEIEHRCEVPEGLTAHVDPDHLRQMLENLVVNAEKYGAPPVVVRGSREGDLVELRVIDAGPGVADDFVARLFDPFTQASTGTRREARGLGLGLDIVRSLATTNGGAIRYEAGHGGACFVLSLPAEPHRAERRVPTSAG
jgi:signal transduction histidine kinase